MDKRIRTYRVGDGVLNIDDKHLLYKERLEAALDDDGNVVYDVVRLGVTIADELNPGVNYRNELEHFFHSVDGADADRISFAALLDTDKFRDPTVYNLSKSLFGSSTYDVWYAFDTGPVATGGDVDVWACSDDGGVPAIYNMGGVNYAVLVNSDFSNLPVIKFQSNIMEGAFNHGVANCYARMGFGENGIVGKISEADIKFPFEWSSGGFAFDIIPVGALSSAEKLGKTWYRFRQYKTLVTSVAVIVAV